MKRPISNLYHVVLATIVTGAISMPVLAQGAVAAPETPAERVAALKAEYEKAQDEFMELFKGAKSDEDKQRLYEERCPKPSAYAPRFLALAREFPKDEAAVEALGWIASFAGDEKELTSALDLLIEHHLDREALASVCPDLLYASPPADTFLRTVLERSPHANVRGQACYTLAQVLAEREADRPEAEKLFERVIAEFGSLQHWRGDLGSAAKRDLFEMRELAVGKLAPEIEGEDIDGVPFKLSDYRGKVVFLDFWGNW